MEIKNKKTGYVFEISDKEGKKLILENQEKFEPVDKKDMPKVRKAKTIREKVTGINCLNALTKNQIIQELNELSIKFDSSLKKSELVELLKKAGGY